MARAANGRELSLWLDDDEFGFGALWGGGNWASIEGSREEWTAIAACLRNRSPISFKHATLRFVDGVAELWSPRNAVGASDVLCVAADQIDALADTIAEAVAGPKEDECPCS